MTEEAEEARFPSTVFTCFCGWSGLKLGGEIPPVQEGAAATGYAEPDGSNQGERPLLGWSSRSSSLGQGSAAVVGLQFGEDCGGTPGQPRRRGSGWQPGFRGGVPAVVGTHFEEEKRVWGRGGSLCLPVCLAAISLLRERRGIPTSQYLSPLSLVMRVFLPFTGRRARLRKP